MCGIERFVGPGVCVEFGVDVLVVRLCVRSQILCRPRDFVPGLQPLAVFLLPT
jgi:hypothetical protein